MKIYLHAIPCTRSFLNRHDGGVWMKEEANQELCCVRPTARAKKQATQNAAGDEYGASVKSESTTGTDKPSTVVPLKK